MKIPKNMTEQQVIEKINAVIERISPRYIFSGYDIDDIKQEAFMICMDAMERYDAKRPLENFLSVHLSNRLKNFIRDNYCTKQNENKKKILSPQHLSYDESIPNDHEYDSDLMLDSETLKKIIDKHLPIIHRADYLKLISDVYLPKKKREFIISLIKNILQENGYA